VTRATSSAERYRPKRTDSSSKTLLGQESFRGKAPNRSRPSFEQFEGFIEEEHRAKLVLDVKDVVLDQDPSSKYFAERCKMIRFATVIGGKLQLFSQNYFVQDAAFNDFSGGYKRYYTLIPDHIMTGAMSNMVMKFVEYYDVPEKTVLLIQIQTTYLNPRKGSKQSITGQGIHTDGTERVGMVCLHRGSAVRGAANQFHKSLDGTEPLCNPFVLNPGDAVFFKDDELYHCVSPGSCSSIEDDAEEHNPACARTILLIASPAEDQMIGKLTKTTNRLSRRPSAISLRDLEGNQDSLAETGPDHC